MTVNDWLAILLPGVSLDEGAVSALSSQCERLYDLRAAAGYGYDIERLKALYVAANLAPIAVEGLSTSVRGVASRREGKVSVTFADSAQKAGWQGTQWGQEFLDAVGSLSGGCILIGHAD
ncbi:DUF4054 domain-containing protein [Salmonella enterica]|uniref:DUF4054 domain-containing protein n=1 Tax=Salmonella enterica subsp. arizonae TaxID=59203 RepID=A0A379S6Z5_SALER|nr:DUF4054 domain-containing protein [Salmonella enterica]SUG15214.1 Uncharacterised protein [Salmonella enterica subsp. arizonae]ECF7339362.1 DUF4054 domain-containing protein [Salmonella enterica]ECG3547714.1 DUF4054 domain-containing protein [Salmonella enterica]EDO3522674.1 DUF4054 domain-containing protein [Salmonella enterica]